MRLIKLFSRLENIFSKLGYIFSRLGYKFSNLENSFKPRIRMFCLGDYNILPAASAGKVKSKDTSRSDKEINSHLFRLSLA